MSKDYAAALQAAGNAMAQGINKAATKSARAAATANGVSAASQSAQGLFNQGSVNNANAIGSQRLFDQYGFNAGQAAMSNQFSSDMWDKTAAWNEMMWERQAAFNAAEAEKQRQWSQMMESTRYQRGMADMQQAGLNPILAYGGIATGAGSGGAASVGGASMSPIQGNMASGGTMNGLSASEGNYTGQMEYMGGLLGLLGAGLDGLSAAISVMSQNNDLKNIMSGIMDGLFDVGAAASYKGNPQKFSSDALNKAFGKEGTYEHQYKKHWSDYWQRKGYIEHDQVPTSPYNYWRKD